MILERIILKNIRSHTDTDITFPKGRILLSGDIGAGKTSILLGLEFALFGIVRGWNDQDTLLRNGTDIGRARAYVKLRGDSIMIERTLKRTSKGISQEPVLYSVNGNAERIVPTEARMRIISLLGYPSEFLTKSPILYRYTVYTPQERMREILSEDNDVRMSLLRKLFGLERYQTIRENSKTITNILKSKISYIQGRVVGLEEKKQELSLLSQRYNEEKKNLEETVIKLESASKDYENALREHNAIESSIGMLNENKTKLAKVNSSIIDIRKEIDLLEKDMIIIQKNRDGAYDSVIESSSKIINSNNDINAIKESVTLLIKEKNIEVAKERELLEDYHNKRRVFEQKLSVVQNAVGVLNERIKNNNMRVAQLSNTITKVHTEISSIESPKKGGKSVQELREQIEALKKLYYDYKQKSAVITHSIAREEEDLIKINSMNDCPTCKQEISASHKDSMQRIIGNKIDNYKAELEHVNTKRTECEEKIRVLEDKEKEALLIEKAIEKTEAMKSEMDRFVEEKERLSKEIIDANNQLVDKEHERNGISKQIIETDHIIVKIKQNITEYDSLLKEYNNINSLLLLYEKHNNSLTGLESKKTMLQESISRLEEEKEGLELSLMEKDALLSEYEAVKEKTAVLRKEHDNLLSSKSMTAERISGINNSMVELKAEIGVLEGLLRKKDSIMILKNFFVETLQEITRSIEYEKSASIRAHIEGCLIKWFGMLIPELDVSVDESYNPIVSKQGYSLGFSNLSGGERTSLSLAFRLALNDALSHSMLKSTSTLIILDEPTDGLSTEQLDQVRIVLDEVDCEQMIIVSHEQKVEGFVDHIIRISRQD